MTTELVTTEAGPDLKDFDLPEGVEEKWVEHLSAIHNVEFNLLNIAISVSVSATPIVLGYLYSLPPACMAGTESTKDMPCIPDLAYAGLPLAPLAILLFYCYLFLNSRIVGKYGRELERALSANNWRRATAIGGEAISAKSTGRSVSTAAETAAASNISGKQNPAAPDGEGGTAASGAHDVLSFPALSRLNGALYGGESRALAPFRVVYVLFATLLVVVEMFTLFYLVSRINDDQIRDVAYFSYALLVLVAVTAFIGGGSHAAWEDLKIAVLRRDKLKDAQYVKYVGWVNFVRDALLPRPLSIGKSVDAAILLAALLLLGLTSLSAIWGILAGWAAFELVLYQTRYFLNGMREEKPTRFSLPADRRSNPPDAYSPMQRLLTPLVCLGRVALFVYLADRFQLFSGGAVAAIVSSFFAVYYLYELPRETYRGALRKITSFATSRPGSPASTMNQGESQDRLVAQLSERVMSRRQFRVAGGVMFVAVGGGYALRAGVVLLLAAPEIYKTWAGPVIVLFAWAVGCAQVSAGWVLELAAATTKPSVASRRLSVGVLAKPQLMWAGVNSQFNIPTLNLGVVSQEQAWEDADYEWWGNSRDRRAPWSIACLAGTLLGLSLALYPTFDAEFRVIAVGAAMLILLVGPRDRFDIGIIPVRLSLLIAIVCSLVLNFGDSWGKIAGISLLIFQPQWKLSSAQGGNIANLIKSAREFWTKHNPLAIVAMLVVRLAQMLFGYPFAHPFDQRHSSRRRGWF